MLKIQLFFVAVFLMVTLFSIPVFATDYSSMDTDELSQLRGTFKDADSEERQAFRDEWHSRVSEMSREDRRTYKVKVKGKRKGFQRVNNDFRKRNRKRADFHKRSESAEESE